MATSRKKSDGCYAYGCFFCLCHSPWQWKHFAPLYKMNLSTIFRHYWIVSAGTNLLVNLIGVWFFRNYACINLNLGKFLMPTISSPGLIYHKLFFGEEPSFVSSDLISSFLISSKREIFKLASY